MRTKVHYATQARRTEHLRVGGIRGTEQALVGKMELSGGYRPIVIIIWMRQKKNTVSPSKYMIYISSYR